MAAFSDWPGRGGGHWLPAYGFTQHLTHQNHGFIEDDDDEESIVVAESACFAEPLLESASSHDVTNLGSAVGGGSGNFLFVLETIVEETTDQLNGDASPRRPASAASSGEHGKKDVPSLSVFDDDNSCDPEADGNRSVSRGSDGEVPKKRRRKDPSSFLDTTVTSGDLSDEEELGSISRSSSLLQFESLERQLENELVPFRTTASSDPFGPPQSPVSPPLSSPSTSSSSSSSSGDDEEEEDGNSDNSSSDTLTGDSFPPVPAVPYSSSSSSSPPSSDSPTANRPRVNRLRSYRSFDSLNLMGARGDDQKDRGGEGFPSTAPWKGGWNHGHNRSLRHMSDRQIYSGRSLNAFRMEPETHEDGFDRGFGSDFRPPPERFGSWSERGNDFFFGEFGGVPEDSGGEMACDEEYGDDFWGDETPTERSFNEDAVARIDEESSEGVTKSMAVDVDSGFASSESPKSTRAGGNRKTSPKTCTREGSNASRRDGDGAVSSLDALGSWQAEEESASKALLLVYSGKVSSVDFDGGATEKSASENGRGGDGNVSLAGGEGTYAYVTEEVKEVSEGETGEDMWKRSGKGSSEKDVEGKENVLGMVGGAEEKGRREVGGCWEVRVERGVVGVVRGSEGRRHNVVERSGANGKAPEELLPLNGRVPEAKGGSLIASERAQVVNPLFAIGDVRDVGYHLGAGSCAGVGAGAWVAEGGQRHASPRGGSTEGGKGLEEEEEEGGRPQRGERSAVRAEAVSEEERGEIPKEVAEESASGERSRVQAGGVVGANDLDSREGKATPPIPTSARQSPALRDSVGSPFVAGIGSGDRVVEGEASREAIARTAAGKEEAAPSSSSSEGTAAVISSSSSSDGEGAEPVKGRSGAEGSSDGEEGLRKQLLVRGSADGEEDHRHGGAESVTAREEVSPGGRGVEEAGGQSGKGSRAGAASGAVSALGRGSAGPVGGVEARVKEGRKGGGVSGSGRGEEAKTEIAVRESEDRSLGETKGGRDEEEEVGSASGHRPFVGGEGGRLKGGGKGVSGGLEKGGHHRSPRLHFFGGAGRHGAHSSSAGRLDAAEAAEIRRRKKFGNAASDYWRGESAVEGFYNGRSRSEGGIGVEGKGRSASEEEEDDYDDEEVGGEEGQGWCIPEGSGRSKGRSASWTESGSSGADGRGWRLALRGILRRASGGDKGHRSSAKENSGGKQHRDQQRSKAGGKGGRDGGGIGGSMRSEGKPPLPPKSGGGALSFLTRLSFRRRKAPRGGEGGQQQVGGGVKAQAHPGIDRELPDGKDAYAAAVTLGGSREADGAGGAGREEGCCRSGRSDGGRRQAPAASNGGGGGRSTSLMDLGEDGGGGGRGVGGKVDATSCNVAASNVASSVHQQTQQGVGGGGGGGVVVDSRAKSMEFLLDEGNKATVLPPENELQKVGVGALGVGGVGAPLHLSEHQLRVQRSLQKLNVPEWYLRSTAGGSHRTHPESGASSPLSLLERRHSSGRRPGGGWPGLASKTTSLSSLQTRRSPTPTRCVIAGTTVAPSTPSSRRLLSPAGLSSGGPSPDEPGSYSSFGAVTPRASFSRWSTSRLHQRTTLSLAPSAPTSPRSSFSTPRAPYLGWRSQERLLLSDPSHYRTPSERLAADLLATRRAAAAAAAAASKPTPAPTETVTPTSAPVRPPAVEVYPPSGKTPELSEVRSSITEVTSAIVHYVSERVPEQAGSDRRSPISVGRPCSPRQLCWVESSFVGSRPIDSPQTPPDLVDGSRRCSSVLSSGETGRGLPSEAAVASCTPNGPVRDLDESSIMPSGALLEAAARRAAVRLELETCRSAPPNPDATLEDVLDSLLGLPPASSSRSPASPASPASPLKHPQILQMRTAPAPVLPPPPPPPPPQMPAINAAEHRQLLPQEPPPATPPPLPQKPPPVIRTITGEARRRNPSHQRRARNQSRAISPTSPTSQTHLSWSAIAAQGENAKVKSVPNPPVQVESAVEDLVTSTKGAGGEDEDEEQAASPSEEDEEVAGGFPAPIASEERNPPTIAADGDEGPQNPPYNVAGDDPMLRPSKEDDAPRRRVSFEIRQLSDDSEADARRRRHCARKRSRAAASCRRVAAAATAPSSPALPVLSRVARQGFLARGRGCVKVFFPGPERAEAFSAAAVSAALAGVRSPVAGEPGSAAATALNELGEPVYAGWADLPLPTGGCGEKCYRDLVQLCRTYDPDSKLVLLVCVCVSSAETPGAGKWSRKVVSRCMSAKLGPFRLAPEPQYHHPRPSDPPPPPPPRRHHPLPSPLTAREGVGGATAAAEDLRPRSPITREMEYPETLVLRALPSEGCGLVKREEAYGNVQKHLKRRGVSLRKQFPDVHRRLRSYVEDGATFAPVAIHPRDGLTGRPFLCVILPEGADEPCWEGEEGGRLKRVDVGVTDEEEEEEEESVRGVRERPQRTQEGGEHPHQVETP